MENNTITAQLGFSPYKCLVLLVAVHAIYPYGMYSLLRIQNSNSDVNNDQISTSLKHDDNERIKPNLANEKDLNTSENVIWNNLWNDLSFVK